MLPALRKAKGKTRKNREAERETKNLPHPDFPLFTFL